MLDAILLPIGEGNRILAQVSNGKIDELIAQTYKGDHEKMKHGDQQCCPSCCKVCRKNWRG